MPAMGDRWKQRIPARAAMITKTQLDPLVEALSAKRGSRPRRERAMRDERVGDCFAADG